MSHRQGQGRLRTVRDPTGTGGANRRDAGPLPAGMPASMHPGPMVAAMDKDRRAGLEALALQRATAEACLVKTERDIMRLAKDYQEQRHAFFEEFLPRAGCQGAGSSRADLDDVDRLLCNMQGYRDHWHRELKGILERERAVLDAVEKDVEGRAGVHVVRGIGVQRSRNEELYERNIAAEEGRLPKEAELQGLTVRAMQLLYGEDSEKLMRKHFKVYYKELAERVQAICLQRQPVARRVQALEALEANPCAHGCPPAGRLRCNKRGSAQPP